MRLGRYKTDGLCVCTVIYMAICVCDCCSLQICNLYLLIAQWLAFGALSLFQSFLISMKQDCTLNTHTLSFTVIQQIYVTVAVYVHTQENQNAIIPGIEL